MRLYHDLFDVRYPLHNQLLVEETQAYTISLKGKLAVGNFMANTRATYAAVGRPDNFCGEERLETPTHMVIGPLTLAIKLDKQALE